MAVDARLQSGDGGGFGFDYSQSQIAKFLGFLLIQGVFLDHLALLLRGCEFRTGYRYPNQFAWFALEHRRRLVSVLPLTCLAVCLQLADSSRAAPVCPNRQAGINRQRESHINNVSIPMPCGLDKSSFVY
jgi:hypothetical protein